VSDCGLAPNEQYISYIMARTSYIWWDDDDAHFILALHTELDFHSANLLKLHSTDRHVALLW
jgi:hypothetical protein